MSAHEWSLLGTLSQLSADPNISALLQVLKQLA